VNPADHYLADRVMTASPAQLTGMLFDALVASVRGAARLQASGDFPAALPRSLKAQRILAELIQALDHEVGGQLSDDLSALYGWSQTMLVRGNRERDATLTQDVLPVVEQLAGAWSEGVLGRVPAPA
jgi:flagellar protein FliS